MMQDEKAIKERLQVKQGELDEIINRINELAQMKAQIEQEAINLALKKREVEGAINEIKVTLGIADKPKKKEAKTK